ncbi:MAG: radical SAM protein [Desulfobacterales bacterium]|nr:radical SAM protein [Desulfobacterales bacterium]
MSSYEKPFIVPVFLPNIGCPHKCVFCNQSAITGVKQKTPSPEEIGLHINRFLNYKGKNRSLVQVSFFGGNFLGLKIDFIKSLLHEATKFVIEGRVDSIRFSTRPDTIDYERLDILKEFPVATVEIGVQSMDDKVLSLSERGHTSSDTEKAVSILKERNYEIGLQMMIGLPGDNGAGALYSAKRIAALSPDFVRIYPTLVLKNTILSRWYKEGKYTPLSLEQCITLVKDIYLIFREKKIQVIRMGIQASEHFERQATILAGPYHPAFGHLVHSEIFLDMASSIIESEKIDCRDSVGIKVHPRSVSKMRGIKNFNIKTLEKRFNIKSVEIIPDHSLAEDVVAVYSLQLTVDQNTKTRGGCSTKKSDINYIK